jgi:hypothetical protein
MPIFSYYRFDDFGHKIVFDIIDNAYDIFPEDNKRKLGIFLNCVGILDRDHPEFKNDVAILEKEIGYSPLGKDVESRYIAVDQDDLKNNYPDTWKRFEENAEIYHHVNLLCISEEQWGKIEAAQIAVYGHPL